MSINKEYSYINLSDLENGIPISELQNWIDNQLEKGYDTVMLDIQYDENEDGESQIDTMNLIAY